MNEISCCLFLAVVKTKAPTVVTPYSPKHSTAVNRAQPFKSQHTQEARAAASKLCTGHAALINTAAALFPKPQVHNAGLSRSCRRCVHQPTQQQAQQLSVFQSDCRVKQGFAVAERSLSQRGAHSCSCLNRNGTGRGACAQTRAAQS